MLRLQDLDAAAAAHLAHGAMAGADPLTDSLLGQLDACAQEGAAAPLPYAAGLTDAQRTALAEAQCDPWLPLAMVLGAVVGLVVSVLYPLGVAS